MKKLEALYKLAILRDEEETDEARKNEARTAAFQLINLARKNGVKIKFEVPKQAPAPAPAPPTYASAPKPDVRSAPAQHPGNFWGGDAAYVEDLFRNMPREPPRRPTPPPDPPFKRPNHAQAQSDGRPRREGEPPLIVAKYAGVCKVCNVAYLVGTKVWWVRGIGSAHQGCGYEKLKEATVDEG